MKHLYLIALLLTSSIVFSQGTIRGTILDGENGETIINATVQIEGTTKGAVTDLDGVYSLSIQPGTYDLKVSFISYQTIVIKGIIVKNNEVTLVKDINLMIKSDEMAEFTVVAEAVRNNE